MNSKLEIQNNRFNSEIVDHLESIISMIRANLNYIYSKSDEKTKKYMDRMLDIDIEFYKYIKSGNKYIDSILLAKYYKANDYNINLSFDIFEEIGNAEDELIYKTISVLDKYVDYFIEDFAIKNKNAEHKIITISLQETKNAITVKVSNNLNEEKIQQIKVEELVF